MVDFDIYRMPKRNGIFGRPLLWEATKAHTEERGGHQIFVGDKPWILLCSEDYRLYDDLLNMLIQKIMSKKNSVARPLSSRGRHHPLLIRRAAWECLGGFQKYENWPRFLARIRSIWGPNAIA